MKNIFFILLTCFSIFSLNSCREDGEWGNENGGQFGFTIERDATFIEKAVGETNQLKFNVVPNYDFNSITTSFKFTTNLNGVLKLNGEVLTANKEYTLKNKENTFEYIGNVAGTHQLKISVKNDKGASKEEEFELKYSVSEFTLTTTGGTADIYQGDETVYNHKITIDSGQPTTGYQIRFDTYDGEVKYNGVPATLGQFYPINNIANFSVTLKTLKAGQGKLTYTIKNSTVERSFEIQQTVIARQIVIESMNVNALNVLSNTQMSLIGVVKKTPTTTNTTIQYKTWLSSASNNNLNGIQTTNNVYTNYALGANGAFTVNFNAIDEGNYTLNIQAKDEFGNESEIKSFQIAVQPQVSFDPGQASVFQLKIQPGGGLNNPPSIIFIAFMKTFKAHSGGSSTITKIKYTCTFNSTLGNKVYEYNETYTGGNLLEYNNTIHGAGNQTVYPSVPEGFNLTDANLKVEVTNSNNQSASIIIPATIQIIP